MGCDHGPLQHHSWPWPAFGGPLQRIDGNWLQLLRPGFVSRAACAPSAKRGTSIRPPTITHCDDQKLRRHTGETVSLLIRFKVRSTLSPWLQCSNARKGDLIVAWLARDRKSTRLNSSH